MREKALKREWSTLRLRRFDEVLKRLEEKYWNLDFEISKFFCKGDNTGLMYGLWEKEREIANESKDVFNAILMQISVMEHDAFLRHNYLSEILR